MESARNSSLAVGNGGGDGFGGNGAVLEDLLVVVDIADEGVERVDALLEAAFNAFPFVGRDNARDQVEGKDPLRAGGIPVDVEGDAQLQQQPLGGVLVTEQLAIGQGLNDLLDQFKVRPGGPVRLEHFVVKTFSPV